MPAKKLNSLLMYTLSFLFFSSLAHADKKNVCMMTINSSNEADTFKKFLSPQEFNFVELTKLDESQWLSKACEKKVNCDVLIISGHFAGSFFGTSRIRMPIEDLEIHSCKSECEGIFKRPKEVFLFGCNTLAGKGKDTRTPQQYRQRLLDEGFTSQQAEQVVAFRYSPLGQSFNDRMARTFSGAQQVIGFNSVSPLGKDIAPMVANYLKNTATDYVDKLGNHDNVLSFFKGTSMVQTRGEKDQTALAPACYFSDKKISTQDKLVTIDSLVRGDNTKFLLENVWHIDRFIKSLSKGKLSSVETQVYSQLAQSDKGKQTILALLNKPMEGLTTVQVNLLNLAEDIGWLSPEDYEQRIQKIIDLKSILRSTITQDVVDQVCSLDIHANIALQDIPQSRWQDEHRRLFMVLLGCLKPRNKDVQDSLVKVMLEDKDPVVRSLAVKALGEIKSQDKNVQQAILKALIEDQDSVVNYQAAWALEQIKAKDDSITKVLANALVKHKNSNVRNRIASALGQIKPQEESLQMALVEAVEDRDEGVRYFAARALSKIKPKSQVVRAKIQNIISDTDGMIQSELRNALAE